jgi:hypothetical protein
MDQRGRKRDRRSTLTEEDVAQIKAHLQKGKTPAALARHFKVHHVTICKIRDGNAGNGLRRLQRRYRYRNCPKQVGRT